MQIWAQVGPLSSRLELLATAIGAGALVGSFAVGFYGLPVGWPRSALQERVLVDGYFGGACGVVAILIDLVIRYFV